MTWGPKGFQERNGTVKCMYQKVDPSEEADEREKGLEQEDTRTQLARDKGPMWMMKGGPGISRRW